MPDGSGHWQGNIQTPAQDIVIEIDLARNAAGEWTGTMSVPSQKLRNLVLGDFSTAGTALSFKVRGAAGERVFHGALSDGGKSLSGDYTQLGYTMPFSLTRTGDAKIPQRAKSTAVRKELEGTWNGTIEFRGAAKQLVLTLANQSDGTVEGNILNVEEGLEIPIAAVMQKDSSLTLDLTAAGESYSGALNTQGTELAGTLTSGSLSIPLTFRRTSTKER
ncbi:MAG: hypothetical protein C5B51_11440 [Terriglobia bacterium]|nr:MAG: hypothetical protein C5B51_11440 [Terriglobia bacterium]